MLLWQQAHYGFWIFEPMSSNLIFGLGFKQANSGRTFLPSLTVCYELSLSFKLHTIQTTEAQKVQSSKRASHVTPFDAPVSFGHEASLNPDKFSQFWFSITFIFPPIDPLSLSLSPSSSFDKSLAVSPSNIHSLPFFVYPQNTPNPHSPSAEHTISSPNRGPNKATTWISTTSTRPSVAANTR